VLLAALLHLTRVELQLAALQDVAVAAPALAGAAADAGQQAAERKLVGEVLVQGAAAGALLHV